jgi:hypothetical protein
MVVEASMSSLSGMARFHTVHRYSDPSSSFRGIMVSTYAVGSFRFRPGT